jgi:hypothetical protein
MQRPNRPTPTREGRKAYLEAAQQVEKTRTSLATEKVRLRRIDRLIPKSKDPSQTKLLKEHRKEVVKTIELYEVAFESELTALDALAAEQEGLPLRKSLKSRKFTNEQHGAYSDGTLFSQVEETRSANDNASGVFEMLMARGSVDRALETQRDFRTRGGQRGRIAAVERLLPGASRKEQGRLRAYRRELQLENLLDLAKERGANVVDVAPADRQEVVEKRFSTSKELQRKTLKNTEYVERLVGQLDALRSKNSQRYGASKMAATRARADGRR